MESWMAIAVDGPAASGKGTLCKALAQRLGFDYLDTGLLYRAAGHLWRQTDPGLSDPALAVAAAGKIGEFSGDFGRMPLRGEAAAQAASKCAAIAEVRERLLAFQRDFARCPPGGAGAVLDGRDIGTVVAPEALLKVWLSADPEVRARRRCSEDPSLGYEETYRSICERDERERTRASAPMVPAPGALMIDTSQMGQEEVFEAVMARWEELARPAARKAAKP